MTEPPEQKPKKLIGVFEIPALEGQTDEEIEAFAAKLGGEIAAALSREDEKAGRDEESE